MRIAEYYTRRRRGFILIGGVAALTPALASAAVLALAQFGFIELPGSMESDCSHALASPWGGVASVFTWPVAFVGLAYLAAVTAGWLISRGAVPRPLLNVLRFSALLSIICAALAIAAESRCVYWLVVHAGNFAFWLFAEFVCRTASMSAAESSQGTGSLQAIVTFGAVLALVSALLMVAVSEQEQRNQARLLVVAPPAQASVYAKSIERSARTTVAELDSDQSAISSENQALQKPITAAVQTARRWCRLGAETAPLQIVAYLDYQCQRSAEIDHKLHELYRRFGDVLSIRVRHYPRSTDCNYSQPANLHPNACQAAKAVEAAAALRGANGFWQMHQWLFERTGAFSKQELETALRTQNYDDVPKFVATMESPEILRSILDDIVEAESLGIKATPLVMLNGERMADKEPAETLLAAIEARLKQHVGSQGDNPGWLPALGGEEDNSETFPKEMQASAIKATVRIVNDARNSVGSGVIVSVRPPFVYILTAQHVVAGAKALDVEVFSPQSYPRPSRTYAGAQVIATSPRIDAALLRLSSEQPGLNAVRLAPQNATSGDAPFLALSAGCTGEVAPTCQVERVIGSKMVRRAAKEEATLVWEVRNEAVKGRSGGPLLDYEGRLLGIASGRSEGRGYYCHVLELRKFLVESPVKWLAEENPVPSEN